MRQKLFSFFILLPLTFLSAYSQIAIRHAIIPPRPADSTDVAFYSRKNPLRAISMNFGLNMGIWAIDRYALQSDFAYINSHTIKENLTHGFVWDNDQMGTNMFLHPYHGSLYYNSARSNGYNYWQSGIFALGGSTMWELFMENEHPSANDIIATPIGGMALGEMFYRVTDLIIDDRKTGIERLGREVAAFIVSPTRGLTRILNGNAWRKRKTSGKQFGMPQINISVSAGIRALELKDKIFDNGTGFTTDINIEYGSRYDLYDKRPYGYFTVRANLNIQPSQPILGQLNVTGRLVGMELIDNETRHLNIGVYQHFDYYDSDTISSVSNQVPYKFCTPASFGAGIMFRSKANMNWNFDTYFHLNGILLGGALSDYYQVENRNYNLASGFSSKNGMSLTYKKDIFALSTLFEVYSMYTWKGYPQDIDWNDVDPNSLNAQGDISQAILHAIGIKVDIKLWKRIYLTGAYNSYTRHTKYKYHNDVFSRTSESKMMLTYLF